MTIAEPPSSSSDGVATRYVADPTLAKLKHLINVPGLGLVRRLVEIIPGESQDEITSKHARNGDMISLLQAALKHGTQNTDRHADQQEGSNTVQQYDTIDIIIILSSIR